MATGEDGKQNISYCEKWQQPAKSKSFLVLFTKNMLKLALLVSNNDFRVKSNYNTMLTKVTGDRWGANNDNLWQWWPATSDHLE